MFCGNPIWQLNSRAEGLANFPTKGQRVDILGFVDWTASGSYFPLRLWGKNSHAVDAPKSVCLAVFQQYFIYKVEVGQWFADPGSDPTGKNIGSRTIRPGFELGSLALRPSTSHSSFCGSVIF